MKKGTLLFLLFICCVSSYTQNLFVNKYNISGNPDLSIVLPDKNIFVTSIVDLGQIIIFKSDSFGNILWSNKLLVPGTTWSMPTGITQSMDNGFLILLDIIKSGIDYPTVLKIDINGNLLWKHSYMVDSGYSAANIIKNSDNGFMLIGGRNYIIKCDQNGSVLWQKKIALSSSWPSEISSHDFNKIVVAGYRAYDMFFYEIDLLGNIYWNSIISFSNHGNLIRSIKPCFDGGYIATGQTSELINRYTKAFILKIDSIGVPIWFKVYSVNNRGVGNDIIEASDSSIVMVGIGDGNDPSQKGLIIKTDKNGNLIFAKSQINSIYNEYSSINVFSSSKFLLIGASIYTFIAMTDPSFESLCNIASMEVQEDTTEISFSNNDLTTQNLSFRMDSIAITYTPTVVIKSILCQSTLSKENFNVYNCNGFSPNPFSIQTEINLKNDLKNATLTLFNSFGKQVKQVKNIYGNYINIQRDNLPSGLYLVQLTQDNIIIITNKLIVINQ